MSPTMYQQVTPTNHTPLANQPQPANVSPFVIPQQQMNQRPITRASVFRIYQLCPSPLSHPPSRRVPEVYLLCLTWSTTIRILLDFPSRAWRRIRLIPLLVHSSFYIECRRIIQTRMCDHKALLQPIIQKTITSREILRYNHSNQKRTTFPDRIISSTELRARMREIQLHYLFAEFSARIMIFSIS